VAANISLNRRSATGSGHHAPDFRESMKAINQRLVRVGGVAVALVLVAIFAFVVITWNEPLNQFRRALTERHELRSESDEFGDHSLFISGRLPVSRFKEMSELLGLSGKWREEPEQVGDWQRIKDQAWRVLPESFDEEYRDQGVGYSVLLGRSGDRVFYQAISW
jgi:hypothetical protein